MILTLKFSTKIKNNCKLITKKTRKTELTNKKKLFKNNNSPKNLAIINQIKIKN